MIDTEQPLVKSGRPRFYRYDSVKFFTVLAVVLGHLCENCIGDVPFFGSLFLCIYAFHMPLFIFLMGLFEKRYTDSHRLEWHKIAFYISLGYLLKGLIWIVRTIQGKDPNVAFFYGKDITWFMFTSAMWMVTAYLVRKVHPAIVLTVSFLLGTFCGYVPFICDVFYASRYLVFMPFYLLGYYLTPEQVTRFVRKNIVRIPAVLLSLIFFVLCFTNLKEIYPLRYVFTGRNQFYDIPVPGGCGFHHRLLCYLISAVVCIAVLSVFPDRKIPLISAMGQNTLSVYFWHKPILYLLSFSAVAPWLQEHWGPVGYVLVLLLWGTLLTVLLSLDPCMVPLKLLHKGIVRMGTKGQKWLIALIFLIGSVLFFPELIELLS